MMSITTKNLNNISSERGFSLIEILVSLALVSLIMGVLVSGGVSFTTSSDDTVEGIERAVRFSVDEAALRNSIIRIHFDLSKSPQSYTVEYGPNDSFVIPLSATKNTDKLSVSEQENHDKKMRGLNQEFNRVREFGDEGKELPDSIRIVGVGSSLQDRLVLDDTASVYIYPTGEKDSAIIFVGTSDEVVAIMVDPFTMDIKREYITLGDVGEDELEEKQIDAANELFGKWKQ